MARQIHFARLWIVLSIVEGILCHGILLLFARLLYAQHALPEE